MFDRAVRGLASQGWQRCVSYGDAHVYLSHLAGAYTLLGRDARPRPQLNYGGRGVLDTRHEDLHIDDYNPHPFVPFEVAV
jgi:thymidylate synthase